MGVCCDENSILANPILANRNEGNIKNENKNSKNNIEENKNKNKNIEKNENLELSKIQTQRNNMKEVNEIEDLIDKDISNKPADSYLGQKQSTSEFNIDYEFSIKLNDSLCKITNKYNKIGIGFFCLIPFPTYKSMFPVLITNSYVLENDEISLGKKINITLNWRGKIEILIDNTRKIYNKNGIIMISIKEEDNLYFSNFLNFINFNNITSCHTSYSPQKCLLFLSSGIDKKEFFFESIQVIDKYNYIILDPKNQMSEASGSPIINKNNDVIGIHMKDIKGKILQDYIREFYEIFSIERNPKDEITIIYQFVKGLVPNINIFGKKFVENNKDKCKMIIKGRENELIESLDSLTISDIFEVRYNSENIVIKLKGINNIIDASSMFKDCSYLISLPDIGKWDISKVTNMKEMFSGCELLTYISNNISKWNTSNLTNIFEMFKSCNFMVYFPDISKWNTSKLKCMEGLFSLCEILKEIPDISNWNTQNVENISCIFSSCKSLTSLPDISKWNINKVTKLTAIFEGCVLLKSLPDISKWNTNNITNLDGVFNFCCSLISLPDISKWNTSNVTSMRFLFQGCNSLKALPDLSKWDTSKVTSMAGMFNSCTSLTSLPDITKWNTSNVTSMELMFNYCERLESFPNISTWDIRKVTNAKSMFNNCYDINWLYNNISFLEKKNQ